MSMIIDGTNGLTFNNATTQSAAGLVVGTASAITTGTAVASTSGTSIDFTNIPSWVKRVTVMFNGVSTNGSSVPIIQLGAGSVDATSYNASSGLVSTTNNTTRGISTTTGFGIYGASSSATYTYSGAITFSAFGSNSWVASGCVAAPNDVSTTYLAGSKTLSGVLDRVRITTSNGTDTFDAGSINILYE